MQTPSSYPAPSYPASSQPLSPQPHASSIPAPSRINWNHLLIGLSLLSLLSFAGLGSRKYRWLVNSIQLVGFGCAVVGLLGTERDRRQGIVYGHQRDILEATDEVSQVYQVQLAQMEQHYRELLGQWETAYNALHMQMQQLQQAKAHEHESQARQLTLQAQQLSEERDRLGQDKRTVWQHLEQAQEQLEEAQTQLAQQQQALTQREAQFEADIQTRIAQAQADLEQQDAAIHQKYQQEFAQREATLMGYAEQAIQQYEASKQPEFPAGHTPEELLARDAIRCLQNWSIIAKKPMVTPGPGKRFALSFEVFPVLEDGTIKTAIRSATEALKLIQKEVLPALKMAVPSCATLPTIQPVSDLRLELSFDISGVDWEAIAQQQKERQQQIIDPAPSHLVEFVSANPHINFMADSGQGKTTLLNNLTAIAQAEFGPETTLIGVNPKPDENVDYSTLKYIGFEESIYGLLEAAAAIYHRVETNNKIIRANRMKDPEHRDRLPAWSPMIYLIDEYTELMGVWNNCKAAVMEEVLEQFYYKLPNEKRYVVELIAKRVSPTSFAGDLTKICWRVGRSEKVKLIIAGQNLKANVFKVNIQDIQQQAYIYAGQAILEGIEHRIQPWHKERIQSDYALRENAVLSGQRSKYYGLFVPKEGVPYFSAFPEQNQYVKSMVDKTHNMEGFLSHGQDEGDRPGDRADLPSRPGLDDSVHHLESCWDKALDPDDPPIPSDPNTGDPGADHRCFPDPMPPPITGDLTEHPTEQVESSSPAYFDPLEPDCSSALVEAVMTVWLFEQSQNKVIEKVWGVTKGGRSKKYRAAKHHFRCILHRLDIVLPGKPWGDDPDDTRPFEEVIG
ncbi:MAG: hypothetical protein AAGD25_15060 [Cyanobacteria bacterium P01_F01_bin.150]